MDKGCVVNIGDISSISRISPLKKISDQNIGQNIGSDNIAIFWRYFGDILVSRDIEIGDILDLTFWVLFFGSPISNWPNLIRL